MLKAMYTRIFAHRFWTQTAKWQLHKLRTPGLVRDSLKFWEENRGKYRGRRGFVIGNGPSLKMPDLTAIANEITIASNKIYLAFPETVWRPTYHTVTDALVWAKVAKEMCEATQPIVISSNLAPPAELRDKVMLLRHFGPAIRAPFGFSDDMTRGFYSGYTVTMMNLQIAAHLGLNPIYLIGCDHFYGTQQHKGNDTNKPKAHDGQEYHFAKGYRAVGEIAYSAPIDLMNQSYDVAYRDAAKLGIQIFNATRGGYLESFPRANFDELVGASAAVEPAGQAH